MLGIISDSDTELTAVAAAKGMKEVTVEVVVEAEAVDTFWRDLIKSSKRFSASVEVLFSSSVFLTSIALAPSVVVLGGCLVASAATASTVCSGFFFEAVAASNLTSNFKFYSSKSLILNFLVYLPLLLRSRSCL